MTSTNKWLIGTVLSIIGIGLTLYFGLEPVNTASKIKVEGHQNPVIYVEKTGDNATFDFSKMTQIIYPDAKEVQRLENEVIKLKGYQGAFPDRPMLLIANPKVTLINYTPDVVPNGLVKGGFEITFINIGGVNAKDVMTKWSITDNERKITGLDEWLTEYLGQRPLVIKNIPSGEVRSISYVPDMTTYGKGKITFLLEYSYINPKTSEKYMGYYSGFTIYEIAPNNIPQSFVFNEIPTK